MSPQPWDSLNLSCAVRDRIDRVAENRVRLARALELSTDRFLVSRQVHGVNIRVVESRDERWSTCGEPAVDADGMITCRPGLCLTVLVADCAPVFLWDPEHRAAGILHAGWRGLAQGICRRGVEAMEDAFATRARDLIAAVGPCIGPCCYEVGSDVVAAVKGQEVEDGNGVVSKDGKIYLDLAEIAVLQMVWCGVRQEKIDGCGLCTRCRQDLFFSHRGSGGRTGRFAAGIMVRGGNG